MSTRDEVQQMKDVILAAGILAARNQDRERMHMLPHFTERLKPGRDGCWLWTGGITYAGYGYFSYRGRGYLAHRMTFWLFNGSDPGALYCCHKCDVRKCVNPAHIFLGTAQDNTNDARAKGRLSYDYDTRFPGRRKAKRLAIAEQPKKIWELARKERTLAIRAAVSHFGFPKSQKAEIGD